MLVYILVFILAFLILARSSDFLVRSLTRLGKFFQISEYAIAFIFMSMATSIPELFVGVTSAVRGSSDFSLGAVLGSNLVNITLVMGLIILLGKGLKIESKISSRNFWLISGLSFVPLLLSLDGILSRGDGLVLLLLFVLYFSKIKKDKAHFKKTVQEVPGLKEERGFHAFRDFAHFFLGLFLLVIASSLIVWSGNALVSKTVFNALFFGIIFVSLGTSLPEIVFGIRARLLNHDAMAMGTSLGSNAFNSTLIIGLVALIKPVPVEFSANLLIMVVFSFGAVLFFNLFVFSKSFVSRKEGFLLLLIYFTFLVFEYFQYFA